MIGRRRKRLDYGERPRESKRELEEKRVDGAERQDEKRKDGMEMEE